MFKLPFGWLPGHWGLAGKTREIAKAEYELSGFDLEKKLLELKQEDISEKNFKTKMWDLELKYGKIDSNTYNRNLASLIEDKTMQELAYLSLDKKDGLLTETEYEKRQATITGQPWVTVLGMDFSKGTSLEGSFELDWNEHFVDKLRKEGYNGPTPDVVVNQWFMELCRNIAMEEFDGTGNFAADSAANLETFKRWSVDSKIEGEGKKGYS